MKEKLLIQSCICISGKRKMGYLSAIVNDIIGLFTSHYSWIWTRKLQEISHINQMEGWENGSNGGSGGGW